MELQWPVGGDGQKGEICIGGDSQRAEEARRTEGGQTYGVGLRFDMHSACWKHPAYDRDRAANGMHAEIASWPAHSSRRGRGGGKEDTVGSR